jgi:hypothetical protein
MEYFPLWHQLLRGRRPVRADHRLRTDEKHIRAPSAIWYKTNPQAVLVFNHNRVFLCGWFLSAQKNTVGARSAQVFSTHATPFET